MVTLSSYPKVWNLGHPAVEDLFDGDVVVQEKIDGSQFSFGMIHGELLIRSKGAQIHPPVADKLFKRSVDTVIRLHELGELPEGYIFRGEAMCGPKHNTLEYDSAPSSGIVLFDISSDYSDCAYMDHEEVRITAEAFGLGVVPELYRGVVENIDHLRELLNRESFLGGPKIEGVVIKNYSKFGPDGKVLMGKIVSEAFKEKHARSWGVSNPGKGDIIQRTIERYTTDRRWEKAIERSRDNGELENSPRDIGPLINSIMEDVREEEEAEIKEILFKEFWPQIRRGLTRGFPEWYKNRLMESQFNTEK